MKKREGPKIERVTKKSTDKFGEKKKQLKKKTILVRTCSRWWNGSIK